MSNSHFPCRGSNWINGTEEKNRSACSCINGALPGLAPALSTQHPDFIWYICHQLDIGRGKALAKLSESDGAKPASVPIIHQIEELLKEKL